MQNYSGKVQRRRTKWKCGYPKDSLITAEVAASVRDRYLKTTADGIFQADIDCYPDVDGEHSVFRDVSQAMTEWYLLLINKECMFQYYVHHNLKIDEIKLTRTVPDALVVMFDGSNAKGVYGSNQISIGSIKWSGNEKGYKSSTQNSLMYLVGNRSEDNEGTKSVELAELSKIRQIRNLGKYEVYDSDGRLHVIYVCFCIKEM